jgi:hypothetical protein
VLAAKFTCLERKIEENQYFWRFFRCLIPCADKNAPAVGLRQNPDKNAMKWPKKNLSAQKILDQAFWGVVGGPYMAHAQEYTRSWIHSSWSVHLLAVDFDGDPEQGLRFPKSQA